ncbi:hypothetical protein [Methylosarcina fibrata]|nr:hypothetical protein [Methylosarcina fibrata]
MPFTALVKGNAPTGSVSLGMVTRGSDSKAKLTTAALTQTVR